MIRRKNRWCVGVFLAALGVGSAGAQTEVDWAQERAQVERLGALTQVPAMRAAEGVAVEGNLRPIYFDGLAWQGKPTRVFAWLGLPSQAQAKGKGKVPGVVLVHGGGGTAFKEWVQKWNAAGFAAISIAVEGQTDRRNPSDKKAWMRHPWAGPARSGIYHDSDQPLTDQWMYHAVADTILAHSLLRSLPEVDAEQVGLAGISWGGVITSTVMGIDSRFAFAIPIYGCGNLADAPNQYGRSLGNNPWYRKVWDPMLRLEKARMPALWFSWPNDSHFPMDSVAACVKKAGGPQMISLVPGMRHGHGPGWNRPESYAFAQGVVASGKPWAAEIRAEEQGGVATFVFRSSRKIDRAELVSTTDGGVSGSRKWVSTPARVEQMRDQTVVRAPVPAGTTAWYLNGLSGDIVVSSSYQEVAAGAKGPR